MQTPWKENRRRCNQPTTCNKRSLKRLDYFNYPLSILQCSADAAFSFIIQKLFRNTLQYVALPCPYQFSARFSTCFKFLIKIKCAILGIDGTNENNFEFEFEFE